MPDPHFNVFYHYGDKVFHEDNFTRALWVVLSRSQFGKELTHRFLSYLANQEGLDPSFRDTLLKSQGDCETHFDFQVSELEPENLGARAKILVGLAPEESTAEAVEPSPGGSRPDACLVTDDVCLLFENKVVGALDHDQLQRHRKLFGKEGPIQQIQLTWPSFMEFFANLPDKIKSDILVADFIELVSEQPHLIPKFLGLTSADLSSPNWKTQIRLAKAATELVSTCDFLKKEWRKSGGFEWDLYTVDQPELVGNLGFACWEKDKLTAKLAVGNTRILADGAFQIPTEYEGRYGMDRLLQNCEAEKLVDFEQIGLTNPEVRFVPFVVLRRVQSFKWCPIGHGFSGAHLAADPTLLCNELKRIHTYGETASDQILEEIKGFNSDFDVGYYKIPDGKGKRSGFYQTAGLLVVDSLDAQQAAEMNGTEQLDWLGERMNSFHSILQELSNPNSTPDYRQKNGK
ncbi:hypothetical protein N9B53_01185 [Mariniblastus sp.]|nr:hypothetical protein [Mariniblastus sp.]